MFSSGVPRASVSSTVPLVFSFGQSFIRVGVSGEVTPRAHIRTPRALRQIGQSGTDASQLSAIKRLIRYIYLSVIRIHSRERKVIIIENVFFAQSIRFAMLTALTELNVPA